MVHVRICIHAINLNNENREGKRHLPCRLPFSESRASELLLLRNEGRDFLLRVFFCICVRVCVLTKRRTGLASRQKGILVLQTPQRHCISINAEQCHPDEIYEETLSVTVTVYFRHVPPFARPNLVVGLLLPLCLSCSSNCRRCGCSFTVRAMLPTTSTFCCRLGIKMSTLPLRCIRAFAFAVEPTDPPASAPFRPVFKAESSQSSLDPSSSISFLGPSSPLVRSKLFDWPRAG